MLGFAWLQNRKWLIVSGNYQLQKFANDLRVCRQLDSCEKSASNTPISSGAKIVIFRKSSKPFLGFLDFRRIFALPISSVFAKTLKMRLFPKIEFSQMILMYQ